MQTNGKNNIDTMIFLTRFKCLPNASHRYVDRSLGGSVANRCFTNLAHTLGVVRTYPESEGSSMTRSTRVALCDPHGMSTIPLTNPPPEHRTIFSRASTESQATKPSRRWQPPRVTSTTGLQLDHLVPLDTTSRCNRTRITHSHNRMITIKYMCDGGLPSTHKHGH